MGGNMKEADSQYLKERGFEVACLGHGTGTTYPFLDKSQSDSNGQLEISYVVSSSLSFRITHSQIREFPENMSITDVVEAIERMIIGARPWESHGDFESKEGQHIQIKPALYEDRTLGVVMDKLINKYET